jgi:hypothetical protein
VSDSRTRIVLIGCGKKKRRTDQYPISASGLYTGPIFGARLKYALGVTAHDQRYPRYFIVSAEHRLLSPTREIYSYDKTIADLSPLDRQIWSMEVIYKLLCSFTGDNVELNRIVIELHMGADYAELLTDKIVACGMNFHWPVKGLGQGEQLAWYKRQNGRSPTP